MIGELRPFTFLIAILIAMFYSTLSTAASIQVHKEQNDAVSNNVVEEVKDYHGFYFSKSVFESFQLPDVEHWYQLLDTCTRLTLYNRRAFYLDLTKPELIAGWFDFLNIQLNGLAFQKALIDGESSYNSRNIAKVFEFWTEALDRGCFAFGGNEINRSDIKVFPVSFISSEGARANEWFEVHDDIKRLPMPTIATSVDHSHTFTWNGLIPVSIETSFLKGSRQEMSKPAIDIMVMFLKGELRVDEAQHTLELYRRHVYDQ